MDDGDDIFMRSWTGTIITHLPSTVHTWGPCTRAASTSSSSCAPQGLPRQAARPPCDSTPGSTSPASTPDTGHITNSTYRLKATSSRCSPTGSGSTPWSTSSRSSRRRWRRRTTSGGARNLRLEQWSERATGQRRALDVVVLAAGARWAGGRHLLFFATRASRRGRKPWPMWART
ncbi:hypothetical protein PVAP13_7KG368100 [Panicum virgatum]|uniref:Uncharacterized protein n=1 Tax=Panicum virgatum TaxID=38727 RepID=A0A8T0QRY4_PANVG|nr:hypothetical protein PVAP13_7KG368100 [Panicum virgatum]